MSKTTIAVDGETYTLTMTCGACPEQYDVTLGDEDGAQVGYLRLRHGEFTVDAPDVDGREIYCALPAGDGMFEDDERDGYLQRAVGAIHRHRHPERYSQDEDPYRAGFEDGFRAGVDATIVQE